MDYQKIGSLISTLRKEKDLTQKELADKLGITDRAVSKWERGLGCPDISLLDDLSKILDISIIEILKGRRLDKDEIVNNKSIIESMNYSKESIKYRLRENINLISYILIIMIILLLVFFNLKSTYYLNKRYYNNYSQTNELIITEVTKNIKTIKNNQGIYNDNDYNKILDFINEIEQNLNKQDNSYYLSKSSYSYIDMVKFYVSHKKYNYYDISNHSKGIYEIVNKYNSNILDNIISYYNYNNILIEEDIELIEQLNNPYKNNGKIRYDIASSISDFIYHEYYRDNILLKDIIKVGEIHE